MGMLLVGSLLVRRVRHTSTQLPFKDWLFGYQYGDVAMVATIQMTQVSLFTGLDYWT